MPKITHTAGSVTIERATYDALRVAACIAFRAIDQVNEHEREAVLTALIEVLPEHEAGLAQDALFHLRAQRNAQATLAGILQAHSSLARRTAA